MCAWVGDLECIEDELVVWCGRSVGEKNNTELTEVKLKGSISNLVSVIFLWSPISTRVRNILYLRRKSLCQYQGHNKMKLA